MLKVDASLNHVPAKREHVVALLESINQPLVNIPSHGTASTGAFILGTRNEHGYYTVFVYLHQPETKAVVIYVSEPRNLTAEQYRGEENEALRFVESMGFLIDDIKFPSLNPSEQESVVSRIPLFRPPERTVDLYDVADSAQTGELQGGPAPSSGPFGALTGPLSGGPPGPNYGNGPPGAVVPATGGYAGSPGPAPASGGYGAIQAPSGTHPSYGAGGVAPSPASGSQVPVSGFNDPYGGPGSGPGVPPIQGKPLSGPRSSPGPDALQRIGRLLSSFGWLLVWGAVLSAGSACGTTAQTVDQRAVESQLDLAAQHLARQAWPDAVRVYHQVLEVDPKNKMASRGLGVAYYKLERFEKADEFLRQTIKRDPDWSMPKNDLAVVLIEQRRCEEALQLLDQVLGDIFYPTPEYAQHNRARALECLGRTGEAMEQLQDLLRQKPRFCLGYLTLSELAFEHEHHEATIEACNGFMRHCEQDEEIRSKILPRYSAMCYYRKGRAYAALGDIESARASFLRCEATGALQQDCRNHLNSLPP